MRNITAFFKKHPVLLLVLVVFVTAILAYHKYIFEGYLFLFDDMGSDTKQLYIMQYNSVVDHLRSGDLSLWDSTNGFGTSLYQYTLFNPLLWVVYIAGLIFGNAAMAKTLVWIMVLAMILSGVAMWYFLSCFSFSGKAKFTAAYIYSFNGFLTLWGQHFAFLAIMIYMPVLLMLIEKAVRRRRFSPAAALCTGLMILCTYYLSYMFIIVLALYVVLRIWTLRPGGIKTYFSILGKQAGAVLLGAGIGMINLLPSAGIVFGVSSRTADSTSIIERIAAAMQPWPKEYYRTLADRFLSSGLQGNTSAQGYTGYSNYYEAPSVFFTSLFIILLVQFLIYLAVRKWDRRLKAVSIAAVAAGLFVLLIPAGSLPFNFFAYAFSRYTFLLMPFFALLTAFMLEKLIKEKFLSVIGLIAAAAGCIYVYKAAYDLALADNVAILAAGLCTATVVLAVLLVLYAKRSGKYSSALYVLIFLAVAGQIEMDLYSTVAGRQIVHSDGEYFDELYGEDYRALSEWLDENDGSEYRLERDFISASYCMDNLALGYSGVSTYNSTMNSNILEFVNELLPEMKYVDVYHLSFRQAAQKTQLHDLFGIKYIVSKSDTPPYEGYELVKRFGELSLYENTGWTGFASFYTDTTTKSEYNELKSSGNPIDTAALLSQVLILDDEYSADADVSAADLSVYSKARTDEYSIDKNGISEEISLNEDGSCTWGTTDTVYIPFNKAVSSEGKTVSVSFEIKFVPGNNVYISTEKGGNEYIAAIPDSDQAVVNLTLPEGAEGLYLRIQHENTSVTVGGFEFYLSEDAKHTQNASVEMADTGSDGYYRAEVRNDEDGYLLMPIPYENGWSVEVDGVKTDALKADYGFSAVRLSAGEHTVEYTYEQPYFKEGLCATAVSLAVYAVIAVIQRRRQMREKNIYN